MQTALRNAAILVLMLFASTLVATSYAADAPKPSFVGKWEGTLEGGGAKLRVVFNINAAAKGALEGTLDSPDQNAFGLKLDTVKQDGAQVALEIRMIQGGYQGKLSADGAEISGTWTQLGQSAPLVLHRAK